MLGFWGEPVAIIGNGPIGIQIADYLKNNIRFGLYPYVIFGGNSYRESNALASINKSKISTQGSED